MVHTNQLDADSVINHRGDRKVKTEDDLVSMVTDEWHEMIIIVFVGQ